MTTSQTEARAVDTAVVEAIHALRLEQPGRAYDILVAAIQATLAAKDAEIAALKKEAADVVRPFAKIADGEPDNAVFHTGHKVFKAARSFLDKMEGRDV